MFQELGGGNVPRVCVRNVGWKDVGGNVFEGLCEEMFKRLRETRWVERLGVGMSSKSWVGEGSRDCVRGIVWKDLGGNVFQELGWEMFQGFA